MKKYQAELGLEPPSPPTPELQIHRPEPLHYLPPALEPLPSCQPRGSRSSGLGLQSRPKSRSSGSPGAHHLPKPTGKSLNGVRFIAFVVEKKKKIKKIRKMGLIPA